MALKKLDAVNARHPDVGDHAAELEPGSASRKICAESNSVTLKSAEPSRKFSESRIAAIVVDDIDLPLPHRSLSLVDPAGRVKRNVAPPAAFAFGPHPAAMGFNDRPADRKADTHAGVLGRKERLKQIGIDVVVESRAGIGHLDFDHVVRRLGV